jgi:hypothetical protein
MSTLSDAASKALNCSQTMEPRLVRAFSLFPAWNLLQWNSPRPGRHLVLGSDPGPIPYPGPGSCGAWRMFWSKLVRYVALAGQVALAAGIAAIITMVLKYAIG